MRSVLSSWRKTTKDHRANPRLTEPRRVIGIDTLDQMPTGSVDELMRHRIWGAQGRAVREMPWERRLLAPLSVRPAVAPSVGLPCCRLLDRCLSGLRPFS